MTRRKHLALPISSMNEDDYWLIGTDRVRLLILLCCASAALWLVFAKLIVPGVIDSAYHGASFPRLNSMIRGQHVHPVAFYQQLWDGFAMSILLSCIAFWLFAVVMCSSVFFRRFVGTATPGTLGAIRAWTCFILLVSTLWEDLSSIALLPPEIRQPMGAMNVLYVLPVGYEHFLTSETGLWLLQRTTELLLFLGLVGWRTRIVIPLATLSSFVLNGILREYSGFWHQNLVPIYVLAVLSFTPCGDGWSLDRLRKIARGRPVPDAERPAPVYGWARYACWVVIALPYLAAGLSKLRGGGLQWVSATNMRSLLYEQTLYPRKGDWSLALQLAPLPDIVFVLLGIAAISGELVFVTVLFSRLARRIVPAVTMFMHVGIILLQNIVFLDLVVMPLVFYDFSKIRDAIGRRLRAGGPLDVLYDGFCPVCRRTVRVLASVDIFRRLEFRDFRRLDLAEYNASHAQRLTPGDLEQEMYVTWRGRAYGGFYAYRAMAAAIPLFWPLVPGLFLPGFSWLGVSVYRYVARRRFRLLNCDVECSKDAVVAADSDVAPATSAFRGALRPALAISALAVVMLFCWVNRIESYPVTDMHMFSGINKSVVTYYKVAGESESGPIPRAYLEDTVSAMSLNSRYEGLFDLCFGPPDDVQICNKWMTALASAYNRKARPGKRMTAYEIQKWQWDFAANPRDPHYGALTDRFVFRTQTTDVPKRDTPVRP